MRSIYPIVSLKAICLAVYFYVSVWLRQTVRHGKTRFEHLAKCQQRQLSLCVKICQRPMSTRERAVVAEKEITST